MKAMPPKKVYYYKKDRYRKRRGGKAELIDVYCKACKTLLLIYQKDEPRGFLKRCYVDRIFYPSKYSLYRKLGAMPDLTCRKCHRLIGNPIRYAKHGESRLAYELVLHTFRRTKSIKAIGKDRA